MATSRESLVGFYLWDELAAVATTRPDIVTLEERTVSIDGEGAVVSDPDGTTIDVAVRADADEATDEFLRTLNDGSLPEIEPLTADERSYLIDMNGADGRYGGASDSLAMAEGATVDELIQAAGGDISARGGLLEDAAETCQTIQDFAYLHDGPRPCAVDDH